MLVSKKSQVSQSVPEVFSLKPQMYANTPQSSTPFFGQLANMASQVFGVERIGNATYLLCGHLPKPIKGQKVVYALVVNEKVYIGSTSNIVQRLNLHGSKTFWMNPANKNNLLYKECLKDHNTYSFVDIYVLILGTFPASTAKKVEADAIAAAAKMLPEGSCFNQRLNPLAPKVAAKKSPGRPVGERLTPVQSINLHSGGKMNWPSLQAAARGLGLLATNISRHLKGKSMRVGNYTFKKI